MADRWTIGREEAGARLDKFLARPECLGSRRRAAAALERGKVFLNDEEAQVGQAGVRLSEGDRVRIWMDRPGSGPRRAFRVGSVGPLRILYEDETLVVVDKPAGLLTVPLDRRRAAASVYAQLEEHLRPRQHRPFVVHRIDRDTSGIVVFTKNSESQQQLRSQFKAHGPERVYLAVAYGHPNPPAGTWSDRVVWDQHAMIQKATHPNDPRAREAISEYLVIESFEQASLIQVRLRTGKRNQIRLQARLRGHTLVGEQRYVFGPEALRPIEFPRQALHAHRLTFRHPADGRPVEFESPLPDDLTALIGSLRRQRGTTRAALGESRVASASAEKADRADRRPHRAGKQFKRKPLR